MKIDLNECSHKQFINFEDNSVIIKDGDTEVNFNTTNKKLVTVHDSFKVFLFRLPTTQLKWGKFWVIENNNKLVFASNIHALDLNKILAKNFNTISDLIDILIDSHIHIYDTMSKKIENVEQKVLFNNTIKVSDLHYPKRNLISQRRALKNLQEVVVDYCENKELRLVKIYDLITNIDLQREISDELLNLIISVSSQKTNDVMRVLTVISTIFMPLTFIVGVYGMNFKHLPELEWYYGYYALWGVMIIISLIMVYFFKKKNWI